MRSLFTPPALTLAIVTMSVSAFAQLAPAPVAPDQTGQTRQVVTPVGINPGIQTTVMSDPRVNHILGLPTSHCGHVIDLLHANRFRQNCGQPGDFPGACPLRHDPAGSAVGDLVLKSVFLISDGTPTDGPVFDIALCNNSTIAVDSFRISIVGILGRIHVHSPTTTIRVSGMNVGQELHVQMQLPSACMAMGPAGTTAAPFDALVVAVDSFDEWMECDELNNVRIINRSEIGLLVSETTTVTTTETQPGPAEGDSVEVPDPNSTDEAPSPDDSIDLDDLDLGSADESAIRFGDALR